MDPGTRSRRALTRALAILVLIGGFAATQQIEVKSVDALVLVGVAVAIFVTILAGWATTRTQAGEKATTLGLTEAGVFAAGALTIFGIFRTVIPETTSFQTAPILGLGLVLLLLLIWVATDGGGIFGAPRFRGGNGNGGAGDGGAGAARAAVGGGGPGGGATVARLSALQTIVAIVVVLGFAAMIYSLWQSVAIDDKQWARLLEIKGSIEQIAFGALGALLGYAVQGREVEKAKDDKTQAVAVAKELAEHADGTSTPDSSTLEKFRGDESLARGAKVEALKERLKMIESK
jgi:hypothetical protein